MTFTRLLRCSSVFAMLMIMVAMLSTSIRLRAQEVGATLFGTITDATGASVPGASVTVSDPQTGKTVTVTTQTNGGYSVPALTPGTYTVTVERTGFKKSVQTGITLVVFQKARLDIQLELGEASTTIEVIGSAPLLESGTASVGSTVDTRQVADLPLNIRRFGSLPLLFPGSVPDNGGFSSNIFGSPFSETTYASNGARGSGNNVLIDGVDSKNLYTGGFSIQPSPDAVQEFKVQTESFSAVFGKNAGSTINLVTKSGTNEIHGSAFEFLRNDKLDARNFFAQEKPPFRRNQFGGYIGGPIKKNKTFFFGGYEALRARKGLTDTGLVPTPAMLRGDFSELLPDTTIIDPMSCNDPGPGATDCKAFPGNIIPPDRINGVAKKVIPYFPAPNASGAGFNYVATNKLNRNDHQFSIKVDHTFGPHDNLYVRYLFGNSVTLTPEQAYTTLPGFGDRIRYRGQNIALSWSHTFSPTILNEVRLGFSRNMDIGTCVQCPRPQGFMESFGINNLKALGAQDEGFPWFGLAQGYYGIGDSNYRPVESNDMVEKFSDTLTITKGKHTLAMGVDFQPYQSLRDQAIFSPHGQFDFGGLYSNFTVSDFLLGYPVGAGRSIDKRAVYHDGKFWNAFFQDDWHVSKTLTLNIGLRYEYHQLPTDRRDTGLALVPLPGKPLFQPGNAVVVVPGYAQADSLCNQPQYISDQGFHLVACSDLMKQLGFTGRAERSLWFPDRFNYAPRFGFAWRPFSSDKWVVRGGYGLFFELSEFNVLTYQLNNPVQAPNQQNTFESNARPQVSTETAFNVGGAPPLKDAFLSINASPYFKQPYVHEWTFNVQRELDSNTALEVRYLGLSAIQMSHFHYYGNQAVPGLGPIQPRRLYPDLGITAETASGANANYNSLQAQLTHRMSKGLSFLASYTWGKSITNNEGEEGAYANAGGNQLQNDNNPAEERARGVNDARQRLVFSPIFELPFGKGRKWHNQGGALSALTGGWEVSAVVTFQTGFPFTPLAGYDVANVGTGQARPDRICNGALPTDQRTPDHWFDTKCFTDDFLQADFAAGQARFGNSGRNILDGPGIQNWDFGIMRDFQLMERLKMQFRAEFFNAFNMPPFQLRDDNADVTSGNYGKITNAGEPRDIQFGLKLIW